MQKMQIFELLSTFNIKVILLAIKYISKFYAKQTAELTKFLKYEFFFD